MKTPELILFAHAPVPGEVKTRLAAHCGPQKAAEIAALMVRMTVELAADAWPGEVSLYVAPDSAHPLFRELAGEFHIRLAAQVPGDPGQVMHAALSEGIARHGAAAALGCDVPHLPLAVLEDAYELLARGKSVLGPAEDGGYYLLGLQAPCPALFEGVNWGGRTLLAETLERAAACGLHFELLPLERDIDTWEDLYLASRRLPVLEPFV
jgi:hypothetical protein